MSRKSVRLWALVLSLGMMAGVGEAQQAGLPPEVIAYPDLVLYNGKIITADDINSVVSAVAVRAVKFLAVWDND